MLDMIMMMFNLIWRNSC